jgi:RimJ/RimL family protein N-acetyltransferase
VRLREVVDSDLDVFFEIQADPIAYALAGVATRDRTAFVEHWARIRNDPETVIRTIDLDGVVAGNVLSFVADGKRVVGYWIAREFWGRGIATEALARLLEIVSERPLEATVLPGNDASVRVLEKNGFRLLREEPENLIFELR